MAVSRGWKVVIGVVLLLCVLGAATPFIAHALVKNKIDAKLHNEFGDLAHYDDIQINWSPLGATLTNLRLGESNPNAGNAPTVRIASADMVLHSATDSEPHLKSLTAHGLEANIYVDEKGESSLAKLIREKVPSKRTQPLTIDNLDIDGITIKTYIAKTATGSATQSPDSTIKVATVHSQDFVLPVPRQLLGRTQWIPTVIENVDGFDGAGNAGANSSPPVIHLGRISVELAQAENTEAPVRLRHFKLDQSNWTTSSTGTETSGFKHVATSLQQGFGLKEPAEISQSSSKADAPHGTGLLIEDFTTSDAEIEIRGGQSTGSSAFWRLKGAQLQAGNLAFGEKIQAGAGYIKLQSATESSSVPGNVALSVTELSGAYPAATFQCSYHIEGVDAMVFGSMAQSQQVQVKRGSLAVTFAGGANQGQLNIEGSVTLSSDFEIAGNGIKSTGVELLRGRPIDHVTVDGPLEHPQIHLPPDLALLGDLMGNILGGGPFGIVNATVGQVPVVGPVVKETTKAGSKVLKHIPLIGELFKGGDKDDKGR